VLWTHGPFELVVNALLGMGVGWYEPERVCALLVTLGALELIVRKQG